jgi:energy-coupling factor transporter ATP-binding protein EcfA2
MDNKVAKTIALNYQRLNRNAKDKFFESLMPAYSNYTDSAFSNIKFDETSRLVLEEGKKDFRLKSVRIANVRGIPKIKNSCKYGIDLVNEGQIQNGIFLGPNGSGKSSLFDAIEFIYSHEVAEKKLRVANPEALNENDFLEYLEHFNEAPECEVETPSGTFSLRNRIFKTEEELKTIYPDTHFISDYDIYKKGQLNYLGKSDDSESFHLLIASSLGLQDYLDFTNLLKSISTYRRSKETTERNKLISNKNTISSEIKINKDQIHFKTEKIKELKESNEETVNDESREKLAATITAIQSNSYLFQFNKVQYQKAFDSYRNARESFLGLSVNQNLQTEAQFLSLGLELINHSENCPFCENSNSSVSQIKNKIEKRILEIKEFETVSKNLEQSIRNLQNTIKDILIKLQSTGRTLKSEIDRIITISEFNDIQKTGKELLDLLADETRALMSVDEKISSIISSNDVLSKKDEAIFNLVKEKETILLIDISNTPLAIEMFATKRQQKITEIESTLATTKNAISPKQQIVILESEIRNHQSTILSSEQQIKNLENEILRLTNIVDSIAEIKTQAGEFAKTLSIAVNKLVAISFEPIKETIEEILTTYLKEENVTLKIRLDEKVSDDDPESIITTIVAEIQRLNSKTGELEIHSPSKYFNTFRFRLFCTMVSISVVIAARKNSGINLPLVLDDVFYASDYNSKTTFQEFITTVLSLFKRFNSEMPLQFILFTHDELVFDSALDAIAEFELKDLDASSERHENVEWKSPIQNRTVFARLFPAKDIDSTTTESPFGKYWDLSYKIPTQLEQLLKTN